MFDGLIKLTITSKSFPSLSGNSLHSSSLKFSLNSWRMELRTCVIIIILLIFFYKPFSFLPSSFLFLLFSLIEKQWKGRKKKGFIQCRKHTESTITWNYIFKENLFLLNFSISISNRIFVIHQIWTVPKLFLNIDLQLRVLVHTWKMTLGK